MLPLQGLTVVSLEQAVAAPFASRQLADLGARVIKIERPGAGDFARDYDDAVAGMSSHFVWCNRSKESITLDLKQPEAKPVMEALLAQADVFIQNLAPGAAERLGYGSSSLLARYPRLIVCNISGYGADGPYRDKKAYDLLVQCEAGLVSITGTEDAPSKAGISVADIAAGMYAYSGILSALLAREKAGGKGTVVEVSMLEAIGEWMGYPLYYAAYGGKEPERSGASHATIYPYGPFRAGDGKYVFLGIQNEREWQMFCERVLGQPELAHDPAFDGNGKRLRAKERLAERIEQSFRTKTAANIVELLNEAQIANARLHTMREFADHPQLAARNRWREVDSPVGPVKALLPPATLDGWDVAMKPIPGVGEHTEALLQEFGFPLRTIEAWRAKGIV
ncbi:CaiB/BaiF CoA transferase family protein [Paenibacillus cymbidii]|uniref:CaiB/BaiF CoA transferase family protein n=1 Tax=Paenibacillus cymbidii TaxID=1639034 RepID=UPI00108210FB|nr:CaiB/BaiF CoA-transferase family protein [Paenibacillus cymbidii]